MKFYTWNLNSISSVVKNKLNKISFVASLNRFSSVPPLLVY